jgi:molybdenum cofactor synthesis domain-containing protein
MSASMEYRLLEKTELWISPVELDGADLSACARAVGEVLGLGETEIMVTDAREDRLTLDILVPTVPADHIVAREKLVLKALASVPGVTISADTGVHSSGILGLISLDEGTGRVLLEQSSAMGNEIAERISKRAIVVATGPEVLNGQIKDTNTPFLLGGLEAAGYDAVKGPVIADEKPQLLRVLRQAAENAFGLVITTGGVGAEGKDQTLEALTSLDPSAITPYVLKFRKGEGRHRKDGVRVGVGQCEQAVIVCLPGPHDEVRLLWPVLKEGLQARWDRTTLSNALAEALRKKFLTNASHSSNESQQKILEVFDGPHGQTDL